MNTLQTVRVGARMSWAVRAVAMLATVIVYGLLSLGGPMLLAGCANTAATPAPRGIVQTDAGRFVACTDCEGATPKHLGSAPARPATTVPGPVGKVAARPAPAQPPAQSAALSVATPPVTPPNPPALTTRVTFAFGQAVLQSEAKAELNTLAKFLAVQAQEQARAKPEVSASVSWRVSVTGYTDDVGRKSPNDRLAAARARAVTAFLQQRLAERTQQVEVVQQDSPGLCCYAEVNNSPEARSRNRRVELVATPVTQRAPSAIKPAGPPPGASRPAESAEVQDGRR